MNEVLLANFQIKFTEGLNHSVSVSPLRTGLASLTLRVEQPELGMLIQ